MSHDQVDKLYLLIKSLEKQINKQNKMIEELKEENKLIIENTTKMGKHIDFINTTYEKLTKSYLFRNIFT
jgi:uncharacterized protein YaaN involved in tellurite resistance